MTRREFALLVAGAAACVGSVGSLAGCSSGHSRGDVREIIDMGGRSVLVPKQIERVFCTNPIGTVDLFGLAPQKLVGWNFRPAGANKRYIPDEYFALPSLGVWMGAGSTPSAEEIAAQDPDVLLCYWTVDEAGCSMADEIRNQTGIPVVLVDYVREAYLHPAEEVRITFDKQLHTGLGSIDLFNPYVPTLPTFDHDEMILEVKFNRVMPPYIRDLLCTCVKSAQNSAISKYVWCRRFENFE